MTLKYNGHGDRNREFEVKDQASLKFKFDLKFQIKLTFFFR